ncbi:ATP-dependent DNA helicase RecG [Pasteurellaceae bacterium HPA106]|uniref:ATP-dependent DNA helicase RecG n=1 Tax=Spirabiliibacterium pneumoniae TaxID=221400 RepID=UPI001AAD2F49|nr:ATP-dependent DNA helicase RecG [Spirabiliibacterium pneumoniae]MBE2896855.1 ATP-dependent DNA helicase RecG [Spirabiliibacterium pneumoniae]
MAGQLLDAVPLTALSGVGVAMVNKLAKLRIHNVQDLLFHLPMRYEDRTRVTALCDITPDTYATVEGIVQSTDVTFGRRAMLTCVISDGTSKLMLRFFNFNAGMKNSLQAGARVKAFGEIKRGRFMAEMLHPQFQIIHNDEPLVLEETLTPIYPSTEGLRQASLRKLTDQALKLLISTPVHELLPAELTPHPIPLKDALLFLHRPPPSVSLAQLEEGQLLAQQRLIYEELLAHNVAMLQSRAHMRKLNATALCATMALSQPFLAQLPFQPTSAQTRVSQEILHDLVQSEPMMRLVQGDVGSGKTLVAALAALVAVENGKQVALMAPTEILAEQHAQNFRRWFEPLGITVGWLAGKVKGKARAQALAEIKCGHAKVVIGTHALFQDEVEFADLALVIIDEQHRFGVHQRLMLREKGLKNNTYPHQLIMTATPIPRTLAMTVYADLDTSIIDELPPGRTPIQTIVVSEQRRDEIVERVRLACESDKRQAYWVCTLIEESEVLEAQAAQATADDLQRALPKLRIGLVHGRMKAQEKHTIMQQFKAHELDLLVATTVIEVGVDVPNASLMIIENAERLGLSQLHQLRGRVGRGSVDSYCVLLYKTPLGKVSKQRLQVMRETQDGFVIAEKDLQIRGPGEVLGTKQTGIAEFKIADLMRDRKLIPLVQHNAKTLLARYPQLAQPLIQRWLDDKTIYGNV